MSTFTSYLHEQHLHLFEQTTTHRLTEELCKGELSSTRLLVYLSQDTKYFKLCLNILGKALSLCDNEISLMTISKQLGFLANNENTYLQDTIKELRGELGITGCHTSDKTLPQVENYLKYMEYLNGTQSYIEIITCFYVMEVVYLRWAENAIKNAIIPSDLAHRYREWIDLHSGEDFGRWVEFLRAEIDRLVDDVDSDEADIADEAFEKTLQHELDFFDACYNEES